MKTHEGRVRNRDFFTHSASPLGIHPQKTRNGGTWAHAATGIISLACGCARGYPKPAGYQNRPGFHFFIMKTLLISKTLHRELQQYAWWTLAVMVQKKHTQQIYALKSAGRCGETSCRYVQQAKHTVVFTRTTINETIKSYASSLMLSWYIVFLWLY